MAIKGETIVQSQPINNLSNKIVNKPVANTTLPINKDSPSYLVLSFLQSKNIEIKSNVININRWLLLIDYLIKINNVKITPENKTILKDKMNSMFKIAADFKNFCKTNSNNLCITELKRIIKTNFFQNVQKGGANGSFFTYFDLILFGMFLIMGNIDSYNCNYSNTRSNAVPSVTEFCTNVYIIEASVVLLILFRLGYTFFGFAALAFGNGQRTPRLFTQVEESDSESGSESSSDDEYEYSDNTMPVALNYDTFFTDELATATVMDSINNELSATSVLGNQYIQSVIDFMMRTLNGTTTLNATPIENTNVIYDPNRVIYYPESDREYNYLGNLDKYRGGRKKTRKNLKRRK